MITTINNPNIKDSVTRSDSVYFCKLIGSNNKRSF